MLVTTPRAVHTLNYWKVSQSWHQNQMAYTVGQALKVLSQAVQHDKPGRPTALTKRCADIIHDIIHLQDEEAVRAEK